MSHDDDFRADLHRLDPTGDAARSDRTDPDHTTPVETDEFGSAELRDRVLDRYADVRPSDALTARLQALEHNGRRPRGRGWAVFGTIAAVAATTTLIIALPRLSADAPVSDIVPPSVSTAPSASEVAATTAPQVVVATQEVPVDSESQGAATTTPLSSAPSATQPPPSAPATSEPSSSAPTAPNPSGGQAWQSPSGNIRCVTGGTDLVTCVATSLESNGPIDCPTGPVAVSLPRGGGEWTESCASSVPAESEPLAYQASVTEQSLTCTSSESGMRCSDADSGRAFLLSRAGVVDPAASLTLTPDSLGGLRLGMALDEVRAIEPDLVLSDVAAPCIQGSVQWADLFFNPDGSLALISTKDQVQVRTQDGLAVGDSAAEIAELYGDRTRLIGPGTSWIGVTLDEEARLEYWIWTDASPGEDPFSSDSTVIKMSLARNQECVN